MIGLLITSKCICMFIICALVDAVEVAMLYSKCRTKTFLLTQLADLERQSLDLAGQREPRQCGCEWQPSSDAQQIPGT